MGQTYHVLSIIPWFYQISNKITSTRPYPVKKLYQQMNGMTLREMDNTVYPVCMPCRDYEKAGFIEGIRLGVLLAQERAYIN